MNEKKNIINYLIEKNNFTKYLEIGVDNPTGNFDLIQSPIKHSVDPCIEFIDAIVDYKYPSDDFFSLLENNQLNLPSDYKWDVVFIDGLHISTQVERDFNNALNHLSENGFILFHDTNPPTLWHAREEYYINGYQQHWNGTVWKVIYKLNSLRSDLTIHTVGGVGSTFNTIEDGLHNDLGWGVSIIQRGEQKCCKFDNPFYEYKKFEENRKEYLNLINLEEFYQIY